jgi:hypothetical protein
VFNVPIGEPEYVKAVLRDKAMEVKEVTRTYVENLEDEYPQELWKLLQYSLQQRTPVENVYNRRDEINSGAG